MTPPSQPRPCDLKALLSNGVPASTRQQVELLPYAEREQ
jgi:hypothetical protein